MTLRPGRLILLAGIALGLAACQLGPGTSPPVCDGIDAGVGGCDPDRPTYAAVTCAGVGEEFGRQLDVSLRAIYDGPEVVDDESRAVRAGEAMSVAASLANLHLRRQGLIDTCGVGEFMTSAATQFSDDLRSRAGAHLYDGAAASYEDWLAAVTSIVAIIDMDEDVTPHPS